MEKDTLVIKPWQIMCDLVGKRIWIRSSEGRRMFGRGETRFEVANHLGLIFEIDPVMRAKYHQAVSEDIKFWWLTSSLPAALSRSGYTETIEQAKTDLDHVLRSVGLNLPI